MLVQSAFQTLWLQENDIIFANYNPLSIFELLF